GSVMPRTLGSGRHRRRPPAVPSFLGTPRDPLSPTWGTRTSGPSGRSNGRRGLRGCPAWAPRGPLSPARRPRRPDHRVDATGGVSLAVPSSLSFLGSRRAPPCGGAVPQQPGDTLTGTSARIDADLAPAFGKGWRR